MNITPEQLLVYLPLGAAIAITFRQIIGIRAIGTFAPALLALNIMQMGARQSGATLLIATGAVFLTLPLIEKLALPRSSRLAIQVVAVLAALVATGMLHEDGSAAPIVVLALVLERTWDTMQTSGTLEAIRLGASTVAMAYAIAALLAASGQWIDQSPWYLLAAFGVAVNLAVGSYRGLRVTELRRFRPVHCSATTTQPFAPAGSASTYGVTAAAGTVR